MVEFDVVVLGSGPGGLAAAIEASKTGARVLLIERERQLGGILKQCIHEGFGLVEFKEKLTGTEYAAKFLKMLKNFPVEVLTQSFVTQIEKVKNRFFITIQNQNGVFQISSKSMVFSTGCRERTSRQIFVHGDRPSGIFTAGTVQYYVNIMGYLPTKKCVILGSGDVGLIMARRLTIEGAKVEGVYEIKSESSGLIRNIVQCLDAFQIPLYLRHTVKRVFGKDRLEAVEIVEVDEQGRPIPNSEKIVQCDALIIAAGLIPENDLLEQLGVLIDQRTKGPFVDQNCMTLLDGVFACGNNVFVSDQVDFVTQLGKVAGRSAGLYALGLFERKSLIPVEHDEFFAFAVPQFVDPSSRKVRIYFRSSKTLRNVKIKVIGTKEPVEKSFAFLRPQQTEYFDLEINEDVKHLTLKITEFEEEKQVKEGSRKIICSVCPKGCEVLVMKEGHDYKLEGYKCQRGYDFVLKNLFDPHQVLCTTVRTIYSEQPLLPVKTDRPVTVKDFQGIMEVVRKIVVKNKVDVGEVICENIAGTGANLVSTYFLDLGGGGYGERNCISHRLWNSKS
ncbi:FAD-dependent oxidoreductase [Pseudothermotoga thermarum]|uniref:FAD/NAD(P)-binding domain-containing protein n=1 Tax=Pseudothermotoga thermarum DSM 5069 TaxID=688269 RepID=F7YXA9_9THEM|nr:FAD-dependent oxidoreductase [Pseudothermotoga thermarum]AEH51429.1 protein of unknown function DUF1667 [Pseudothermotoga thermarum DSM 5069]